MATIFWGFVRHNIDRLFTEGKDDHRRVLCLIIESISRYTERKQPHLAKKVLFHHDNTPAHSSAIATAKLIELRYELLPHPPYSPDLALCDCFLFPNLKNWLGGNNFLSNE